MPIDQYASARPYFPASPPAGLNTDDQDRIQSYLLYENMYWNSPETFKIIARSEDSQPIYLPSARNMIEATHRFLAIDWDYVVNPKVGTSGDQEIIKSLLQQLFKREMMYAKFANQKRFGLIRGDAMWHITADPDKDAGQRISMHELDPGQYFPITDPDNSDRIIGCYIVDEVPDPRDKDKTLTRRQMYRKEDNGTITSELALFELAKWDDRDDPADAVKVQDVFPAAPLPPTITQIPVYHIRNFRTNATFGSSQIRGIETVLAAVNQTISDQDLAISMQGLGVYWTDAGPPKNADGSDGDFIMGPGEVVEVAPGSNFGRVSGISGALPGIEHMKFMLEQASEAMGLPDIARGRADVTIAESGISLMIQMSPLLAQNGEKELEMLGVYDQMFFDLTRMWFPAYEQTGVLEVEIDTVVGDPMPKNRDAQIAEILTLVTSVPQLITVEMAQAKLSELGYEFPDNAAQAIMDESSARALAADPFGTRMQQEGDQADEQDPAAPPFA